MRRRESEFSSDLQSLQHRLYLLYQEIKKPGVDPQSIHIKQREIIDQILGLSKKPERPGIINQMRESWNNLKKRKAETPESDQDTHTTIDTIKGSLIEIKSKLNNLAEFLKKLKKEEENKLGDYIGELNAASVALDNFKITGIHLDRVTYGRNLSEYGALIGTLGQKINMVLLAYVSSMKDALEKIGVIFPPVIWTFNTLQSMFTFGSTALQYFGITKAAKEIISDEERSRQLEEARLFLFENIKARAAIFVLNILTVLAVTGLMLSTPYAWLFVAGSTAFKWYDELIIPLMKLEAKLNQVKGKINELDRLRKKSDSEGLSPEEILKINRLESDEPELKELLKTLPLEIAAKRTEVWWGGLNTLSMAFIAVGPFIPLVATAVGLSGPLAPIVGTIIGAAGLAIFGVIAARAAYRGFMNYLYPQKKETAIEAQETTSISIELSELSAERKLTHTSASSLSSSALATRLMPETETKKISTEPVPVQAQIGIGSSDIKSQAEIGMFGKTEATYPKTPEEESKRIIGIDKPVKGG